MGLWLFKEEPSCYSFGQLEKDKPTVWAGVKNALARKHLRNVQVGDRVLYYHTGQERAIVGEMRVVTGPSADPNSDDPKSGRRYRGGRETLGSARDTGSNQGGSSVCRLGFA